VIQELSHQLDSWRYLLPHPLQWCDGHQPTLCAALSTRHNHVECPSSLRGGSKAGIHEHDLDALTTQLRARFYLARFLLYRPFVYKALHFSELVTVDDVGCCVLSIQAAYMLMATIALYKDRKRLLPHLFTWTHNITGILLISYAAEYNDNLRRARKMYVCDEDFKVSVSFMLDWLGDMQRVDATAQWAWELLRPMFMAGV
jgi:hypothetical protein